MALLMPGMGFIVPMDLPFTTNELQWLCEVRKMKDIEEMGSSQSLAMMLRRAGVKWQVRIISDLIRRIKMDNEFDEGRGKANKFVRLLKEELEKML